MVGHFSVHDNGPEDRVYQFRCCEYGEENQRIALEECTPSPANDWANTFDGPVDDTCSGNKVKVGEISIHNDGPEDRIHRFRCCQVVVEEF